MSPIPFLGKEKRGGTDTAKVSDLQDQGGGVRFSDILAQHREWGRSTHQRGKEIYGRSCSLPAYSLSPLSLGLSCIPTLLDKKGEAHGDLEKDGAFPEGTQSWDLGWKGRGHIGDFFRI